MTSGVNRHLKNVYKISSASGANDRFTPSGSLDLLWHSSKQPRVFNRARFEELLIRVTDKYKQGLSTVVELLGSVPKVAMTADAWTGPI
ncbi:hypothetical protein EC968_008494 [Mortierella alpina]|nr:hypothetical protein EC968_008494 [Mortierella alpina]